MLQLILKLSAFVRSEPCSLHREILNRVSAKRPEWDETNEELYELYHHLNNIARKRTSGMSLSKPEKRTLRKYPKTSSNLLSDRKVPVNSLEALRKIS